MNEVIPIIGPPGAGKSTVARFLDSYYDCLVSVDCGDLVRAEIDHSTYEGRIFKDCIRKGEFIPDDLFMDVFNKTLDALVDNATLDDSKFVLSVGSPKTMVQALAYERSYNIPFLLYCQCPRDICYNRLISRGSKRDDSDDKVVAKRLDEFPEITLPVVRHFKDKTERLVTLHDALIVFKNAQYLFDRRLYDL